MNIGDRFINTRFTIISKPFMKFNGKRNIKYILIKCDCGNEKTINLNTILMGKVKSCGCLVRETSKLTCIKRNTKHNLSQHPLYKIWKGIKSR